MANPTEDEMMADLAAADAAGDSQLAQHIAGRIKAARTPAPTSELDQRNSAGKRFLRTAGETLLNMVRPGQYPLPPPASPRQPGEDDRAYALRAAHEGMAELGTPEGVSRGLSMAAYTMPRGTVDVTQKGSPLLRKSAAAKTLEAQGVKNLTTGQLAPDTVLGQIEQVSTHNPMGLKDAREAAKESWRLSEIAKSRRPGETPLPRDVQGAAGEAYQRFGPEYDAIRDVPVPGDAVTGLPKAAMKTPGGVDARTIAGAKAEIENALTVLPGFKPAAPAGHSHGAPAAPALLDPYGRPVPPTPAPPVQLPDMKAGDLMKVRSLLRDEMRNARKTQDFDRLNQLDHAHGIVTQTLEQNLPPDAVAALRDADLRYSKLMTVEGAAPGGQTDFTPGQLLRSVERNAGRRSFKQGEAGDMQASGEAAREVFTDAPMTGFRGAVLSSVPGMKYAAAPLSRLANTQWAKRALFETPRRPFRPQPPTDAAAVAWANALKKALQVEPIPAAADE